MRTPSVTAQPLLGLFNNKNVKAFFRSVQARTSLEKLGEAHNGAPLKGTQTRTEQRRVPITTRTPGSTHTEPASTRELSAAARKLFEFTRAWDSFPSSDTGTRWALLNVRVTRYPSRVFLFLQPLPPRHPPSDCQSIHPTSLQAFFGSSLEPTLLASFISVLATTNAAGASTDRAKVTSRDAVWAVMCFLTQLSRFRTVV
ncbi:hypothetical protein BJV77DRAFT_1067114 [Russula vinacea]|nr:hypothetical protein BJV77DRAFT_1067114 [Russula vinacea]